MYNSGQASELKQIPSHKKLTKFLSKEKMLMSFSLKILFYMKSLVVFILFWVKVPVLSVQISLAPPMISHDCNFLTKLFSSFILPTAKASAIVTLSGSPSGTAATIIYKCILVLKKYFMKSKYSNREHKCIDNCIDRFKTYKFDRSIDPFNYKVDHESQKC